PRFQVISARARPVPERPFSIPGPQIAQVQLDLSQEQSLRRFANRHTAVRDKHASPPNACIASTPRLRALRPHQTIDQFLSLIVSGGHVVHDLRSLPIRSRSINQSLDRLPPPMSEHRFRLPRLINRQLARIMPTTRVMEERLTKNAALSKPNMHVVVVHPLRRTRRVSHATTTPPLTRTSRRIQQFGRLKLMHRVKER